MGSQTTHEANGSQLKRVYDPLWPLGHYLTLRPPLWRSADGDWGCRFGLGNGTSAIDQMLGFAPQFPVT